METVLHNTIIKGRTVRSRTDLHKLQVQRDLRAPALVLLPQHLVHLSFHGLGDVVHVLRLDDRLPQVHRRHTGEKGIR